MTPTPDSQEPSSSSLFDRVEEALGAVRPFIQADGGDIELVDVDQQGVVKVRLKGACAGCPMSAMTLAQGVELTLKERVPEVTQVVQA